MSMAEEILECRECLLTGLYVYIGGRVIVGQWTVATESRVVSTGQHFEVLRDTVRVKVCVDVKQNSDDRVVVVDEM